MLDEKENVKQYGDQAQAKLGEISEYEVPFVWWHGVGAEQGSTVCDVTNESASIQNPFECEKMFKKKFAEYIEQDS